MHSFIIERIISRNAFLPPLFPLSEKNISNAVIRITRSVTTSSRGYVDNCYFCQHPHSCRADCRIRHAGSDIPAVACMEFHSYFCRYRYCSDILVCLVQPDPACLPYHRVCAPTVRDGGKMHLCADFSPQESSQYWLLPPGAEFLSLTETLIT